MDLKQAALTMTRSDFRSYCRKALSGAAFLASWTQTPKDDAAVTLLSSVIENDEQFNKLADLLGLSDA
jgi:hypothetical protein